jgi:tripartite-type tricarboxylate transporter receptor subunit TctC
MRFLALFAAACLVSPALAQSYPTKPIRIVVPFAPGGGSDFIARFMAQKLTVGLGQQVIVENKPGAGGMLGIEQGVKSPADGYTLTLIASSYTVNPSIYKFTFDPVNDITPIIQLSQGPLLIVVRPSLPVKSTQELIALAKAKPGQVNFASSGQGQRDSHGDRALPEHGRHQDEPHPQGHRPGAHRHDWRPDLTSSSAARDRRAARAIGQAVRHRRHHRRSASRRYRMCRR